MTPMVVTVRSRRRTAKAPARRRQLHVERLEDRVVLSQTSAPVILQYFEATDQTIEQQQWTVAQAIGDHLKPELLHRLGFPPDQRPPLMGESLPNLLAQRLLVPTDWLQNEARSCDYDLLQLKRRFPTASHEVIAWRLLDLSEPCIITLVDNDHIHRRRSNAYRVRKELSEPEKECQRYISRYSRPTVLRDQGWTVQGWPVHQEGWKREILRSVVDTFE